MRSPEQKQEELFCTISIEALIPDGHPLRAIRQRADRALQRMEVNWDELYSERGRPSVPPEQLLRAMLLQILYGYRSERRLMEELQYNFALRWFVGLSMGEEPWDVTVFTKNRERFLRGAVAEAWLKAVVLEADECKLIDREHFSVDGTLIRAWASERSYQPKDDPPGPGQGTGRHGKLLKRDLYESRTDPEARSYRRSRSELPRLSYLGHVVMENRSGLIVAGAVTQASTHAERKTATDLLSRVKKMRQQLGWKTGRVTVAADRAYHEQDFVDSMRTLRIEAHLPAWKNRPRPDWIGEALRRTKRYRRSISRRGWIERCFAWIKGPAGQGRTRFRGVSRTEWSFQFAAGAFNLLRMLKLVPQS
jgi:transposase